jgi:hypothetical protein
MANQIIIDIGAVANDGTGDPLRTAFGYVNNNFSNVWASGVTTSNIQFDGNKILTTNTNGNLVLAPNGIGKVQANVDIVPNAKYDSPRPQTANQDKAKAAPRHLPSLTDTIAASHFLQTLTIALESIATCRFQPGAPMQACTHLLKTLQPLRGFALPVHQAKYSFFESPVS